MMDELISRQQAIDVLETVKTVKERSEINDDGKWLDCFFNSCSIYFSTWRSHSNYGVRLQS